METLESVGRAGRDRLYPSLTNPNWLVLRRRRQIFRSWISRLDGTDLDVLDVGARIQPYRPLFEGRLRSYRAIDLVSTPLVDLVACGEQIPFKDESFDIVLCTQMLEYAPDPRVVVAEIYRVLKPGGVLLLSVPAVFPADSKRDTWRFLPESLRLLLSPFQQLEIIGEGSSISGFFRTICVCFATFARPPVLRGLLRLTIIPILNVMAASLEFVSGSKNDQFSANFAALSRK